LEKMFSKKCLTVDNFWRRPDGIRVSEKATGRLLFFSSFLGNLLPRKLEKKRF